MKIVFSARFVAGVRAAAFLTAGVVVAALLAMVLLAAVIGYAAYRKSREE